MADKGKEKVTAEESSSSTRRLRRATTGAQPSASARTALIPQPSMTAEEQEQEDLFTAQLMSMMGTFEQLAKNPRMLKFMKSRDQEVDSQAEPSQRAVRRQRILEQTFLEHADKVTAVETGPVQHVTQAQDPVRNGQGSNAQAAVPTISTQIATQPGYFGGGSIFQAMARPPASVPGFMPRGSPGMMPVEAVNPLYI